eukprot:473289_1
MTPFLSNIHKMESTILLLIVAGVFHVQINTSQNITNSTDYTILQSTVCNELGLYYDDCSCRLAKWSTIGKYEAKFECFNRFNCYYDLTKNEFCNNNGYCDFQQDSCICNQEYTGDDCSEQYTEYQLHAPIKYITIALSAICIVITFGLIIWLHLYRDVGDVKAMSVVFTHLTLIGCAILSASSIIPAVGYNDVNCVLLELFQYMGLSTILACALLKSYRIASIFGRSTFSPSDLTDTRLLKYFAIIMVIDGVLLVVYTVLNFTDGGAYTEYVLETSIKQKRCSNGTLTMLSHSLLLLFQLVLFLFVIKHGNQTRSASKIFKETKCLYIGGNIGMFFFSFFAIAIIFTADYTLQIAMRAYFPLVAVCMVIGLLFYPKFKTVYKLHERKHTEKQQILDEDGNVITEEEAALKRQYEAHVKDPNGKELLLLLNALVKELDYRSEMKMISIELGSIDLKKCTTLLEHIKGLIPEENEDTEKNLPHEQKHDNWDDFNFDVDFDEFVDIANTIRITCKMELTKKLARNTTFKSDLASRILLKHTKVIAVVDITNLNISFQQKQVQMDFDVQFANLDNLNIFHKKISTQLAMTEGIKEALKKSKFREEITRIIQLPQDIPKPNLEILDDKNIFNDYLIAKKAQQPFATERINAIKIVKIRIEASDGTTVAQALEKRKTSAQKCKENLQSIQFTSLYHFTPNDVSNKIRSWVLNDIVHKTTTKVFMEITAKESMSGVALTNLEGQHLVRVLETTILPYMTHESFDLLCNHLHQQIQQNYSEIAKKGPTEIAEIMSDFALNSLCQHIIDNEISGDKIIQYNASKNIEWMSECTGWDKDQTTQLNSIILKHRTDITDKIKMRLYESLKDQFDDKIATYFCNKNLDLETLQLKIKHGTSLTDEVDMLMNIIQELDIKFNTEFKTNDTHTNSKQTSRNLKNVNFIQKFYKVIAECLKMEDNWICSNCNNFNFGMFFGSKFQ